MLLYSYIYIYIYRYHHIYIYIHICLCYHCWRCVACMQSFFSFDCNYLPTNALWKKRRCLATMVASVACCWLASAIITCNLLSAIKQVRSVGESQTNRLFCFSEKPTYTIYIYTYIGIYMYVEVYIWRMHLNACYLLTADFAATAMLLFLLYVLIYFRTYIFT